MSIGKRKPSSLSSPAGLREEKDQNFLKTPLTLVFSRKGREEFKGCPPHPYPLPRWGEERRKMKRLKQCPLTLTFSRGVEREEET
jgi:hypothetical protein